MECINTWTHANIIQIPTGPYHVKYRLDHIMSPYHTTNRFLSTYLIFKMPQHSMGRLYISRCMCVYSVCMVTFREVW